MKLFEATVVCEINELLDEKGTDDLHEMVEIVISPVSMRGVYAKRNITKNELFIIPLAQNIKFVKKVPLQGAVNLNHSIKDLSGEMLHAMMQPSIVYKPTCNVHKQDDTGVHAAAGKSVFMPLYFMITEESPNGNLSSVFETLPSGTKLPCYTNKAAINKGVKLAIFKKKTPEPPAKKAKTA